MILTEKEIAEIRDSMRWLAPRASAIAPEFYADLWRRDPSLRSLFTGDLHGQGMQFMSAVGLIVDNLDNPAALDEQIGKLSQRHSAFDLKPDAYHTMEEALIDTFRIALGARFTTAMQRAWRSAFHQVAERMMTERGLDPEIIEPTPPLN